MSEVFIRNFNVPANCMECEWRDAEACGECELMISNPFRSFEDQYSHCPFRVIAKRHPLIPVPPHGRLIDADALDYSAIDYFGNHLLYLADINDAPTIIPAEEGE